MNENNEEMILSRPFIAQIVVRRVPNEGFTVTEIIGGETLPNADELGVLALNYLPSKHSEDKDQSFYLCPVTTGDGIEYLVHIERTKPGVEEENAVFRQWWYQGNSSPQPYCKKLNRHHLYWWGGLIAVAVFSTIFGRLTVRSNTPPVQDTLSVSHQITLVDNNAELMNSWDNLIQYPTQRSLKTGDVCSFDQKWNDFFSQKEIQQMVVDNKTGTNPWIKIVWNGEWKRPKIDELPISASEGTLLLQLIGQMKKYRENAREAPAKKAQK